METCRQQRKGSPYILENLALLLNDKDPKITSASAKFVSVHLALSMKNKK